MSLVQGLPFHITVTGCVITTCHLDPFDLQDGEGGGYESHETTADGQYGREGALVVAGSAFEKVGVDIYALFHLILFGARITCL